MARLFLSAQGSATANAYRERPDRTTSPLSQIAWFYHDYWRPEYIWSLHVHGVPLGIEEPLFAFFIGGIGSVMYEVLFCRRFKNGTPRILQTFGVIALTVLLLFLCKAFALSTIWAVTFALGASALVMAFIDRDIRADCMISSIVMFAAVTVMYIFWLQAFPEALDRFWVSEALSGSKLLGVPIEELAWFTAWAMFSGIVYEFLVNAGPYRRALRGRATI